MKKLFGLCMLVLTLVIAPGAVSALTIPVDSFGSSATFIVSGDILTITLTDLRNATTGGQELTAIFFDLPGTLTLTPVSALIGASTVIGGTYPAGGNVGGEWEYLAGLSDPNIPLGATRGISSSGLGVFGDANFNGPNLTDPIAIDGGQWGLTNGTTILPGNNSPLVKNSVVFTLSGANDFVPSDTNVTNVSYFYGTELGTTTRVPEPSVLLLLGAGLIGLGGLARRIKKS